MVFLNIDTFRELLYLQHMFKLVEGLYAQTSVAAQIFGRTDPGSDPHNDTAKPKNGL